MKLMVVHEAQWAAFSQGKLGGSKPEWHLCIAGYEAIVWPTDHEWGWAAYDVLSSRIGSGFVGTMACACNCAESEISNHVRKVGAA